jgi:dTDP-L-rhamnose 4-epimerase
MAERVLITGGAGFIGTRLSRHLLDLGFDVRILDNLHPQVHGQDAAVAPWMRTACDVRVADVRDRAAIESAVDGVDLVIHLASETGTGQ